MSFKKSFLSFLAAIGIIVLPIVYLASYLNFHELKADDVESSFSAATNPIAEFAMSRSATTVILGTSDVEIAFAVDVPNYHVGIEYLKNLTETITIYFDESKHLWTIAVLDTAGTMTAADNLHNISLMMLLSTVIR